MKRWMTTATVCGALVLGACGKKDEAPAADPTPAAETAKPAEPVAEPVAEPTAPEEPAAPKFSEEETKKQLEVVATCEYDFNCPAYKPLVAMGTEIGPQTYALAMDETKPKNARAIAMSALGEVKAKVDLSALYDSVKKADDYGLSNALQKLVENAGAEDTAFTAKLRTEYTTLEDGIAAIPVRGLLRLMSGTLEWALTILEGEHEARLDIPMTDLVTDLASPEQLPRVVALLDKAQDVMVKHRLAATAIRLGDKSHFQVFLDGLASENQYDRSDAANFLANVIEELPAELKDKTLELVKAAKAGDSGGLTSVGYDKCLKKLGGAE